MNSPPIKPAPKLYILGLKGFKSCNAVSLAINCLPWSVSKTNLLNLLKSVSLASIAYLVPPLTALSITLPLV